MDKAATAYASTLKIGHYQPDKTPWRRLGQYLYRIVEDGSQTQHRLAMIESLLPPQSDGPIFHFHEMHDEGFLVLKGRVRFHSPNRPSVDAKAGDFVTVPIRLPHKFSNPFDEEAVFINTITPGFFVRYFEHLEELIGEGKELTPEVNSAALRRFATVPLSEEDVETYVRQLNEQQELTDGVKCVKWKGHGLVNGNGKGNGEHMNGTETNGNGVTSEKRVNGVDMIDSGVMNGDHIS